MRRGVVEDFFLKTNFSSKEKKKKKRSAKMPSPWLVLCPPPWGRLRVPEFCCWKEFEKKITSVTFHPLFNLGPPLGAPSYPKKKRKKKKENRIKNKSKKKLCTKSGFFFFFACVVCCGLKVGLFPTRPVCNPIILVVVWHLEKKKGACLFFFFRAFPLSFVCFFFFWY